MTRVSNTGIFYLSEEEFEDEKLMKKLSKQKCEKDLVLLPIKYYEKVTVTPYGPSMVQTFQDTGTNRKQRRTEQYRRKINTRGNVAGYHTYNLAL